MDVRTGRTICQFFKNHARYIYIIYTPNLGSRIAPLRWEREQGRFGGSTERAQGSIEGAPGEHWGAVSEQGGRSKRAKVLAPQEPDLAAPYPAIAALVVYSTSVA